MIGKALIKNKKIKEALRFIQSICNMNPKLALVLGSGLCDFGMRIDAVSTILSSEIPYYPVSTVQSHAGKLIFGYIQKNSIRSIPVLVFQGRVHFYETGSLERVVFPIVLAHYLGVNNLIVTNAAGGINSRFTAGDLMLIKDIQNNTLMQPSTFTKNCSDRHVDYFDHKLQQTLIECASQLKILLQQGTYCWMKGPSYETPAEINMLKRIGADAVGMSTVPEICMAHSLGMKIVGISLISNIAAGISPTKLSHNEVTQTANKVNEHFSNLMERLVYSIK
jgi:purine-nucleoside phosphorylase